MYDDASRNAPGSADGAAAPFEVDEKSGLLLSRRDLTLKSVGLVALLAGGSTLLAACGGGKPAASAGGSGGSSGRFSSLTAAVSSPPVSLDPQKSTSSELGAFNQMFEGLVNRRPDRTIAPALATKPLERVDATTWRATLRNDRTFTDGSPITVDDVVFSWNRVRSAKFASPYAAYLSFFTSVKAVGKNTIEFKTSGPVDIAGERAAIVKIVPQKVVEAKGDKKYAVNPGVCSGSMYNSQPLSATSISLAPYDKYNGNFPVYTDAATYQYVEDSSTRFANLRGNQLQIDADVGPALYDTARGTSGIELGLGEVDAATKICLCMFNCAKKPFDDKRVRQAVMYAMDRRQLVEIGNQGEARVAASPLPESHPMFVKPSVFYDHDPEKAKSLLKEAGYPNGLDFELNVSNLDGVKEYAPLLSDQLKEAGINVKLRVRSVDLAFPEIFEGKYEAFVFPTQFEIFGYDTDILIRGWWGGTYNEEAAFWTTPAAKRVPQLLDQALVSPSKDEQKRLYGEAQQIIVEEAASCPMVFQPDGVAWSDSLKNFQVSPVGWAPALYGVKPA